MISKPFFVRLAGHAAILLAAGTLTACSVETDDRGRSYNPRPPQFCTREYSPVCGESGGDRQTFANACEARSSGYRIVGRGECQFRRPDRDPVGWQNEDRDGWQSESSNWDRPDRDKNRKDRDRRDRKRDERSDRSDRERPRDQRACAEEGVGFSVNRQGRCVEG